MLRAKFFSGRANSYLLTLKMNGSTVDPATTTKIAFWWPDQGSIANGKINSGQVDSQTHPQAFSRESGGWRVNLGAAGLTPGVYKMSIIVFSEAWPEGKVWAPYDKTTVEIIAD